jgi:hypothetical protein
METKQNKPRCVIVFDSRSDYEEIMNYAKTRGLDMKNFFMFAAKHYVTKYPQKTGEFSKNG